jgi:hypothetical protein
VVTEKTVKFRLTEEERCANALNSKRKYDSGKGIAARAAYEDSAQREATRAAYENSEKAEKARAVYENSEEGVKARAVYNISEERQATRAAYEESNKGGAVRNAYEKSSTGIASHNLVPNILTIISVRKNQEGDIKIKNKDNSGAIKSFKCNSSHESEGRANCSST